MMTVIILAFMPLLLSVPGSSRGVIIENFDDGVVDLISYPGEDFAPDAWLLDSVITFDSTMYSLKIFGNTWKIEPIAPHAIDSGEVWQVAAFIDDVGEIQGFGLADSACTLRYAFAGSEQLDITRWITVYQGAFPLQAWNVYCLPVAEDWIERFGYLPTITALAYINDRDFDPNAVAYFDEIINITEDLPIAPEVQIEYQRGTIMEKSSGERTVTVQFNSIVFDPDGGGHLYHWYFGDDSTSSEPDPTHTYTISDDHSYTVLLEVVDSTGLWGRDTCHIHVDPGSTSYPFTMTFVGDIMLARRYEEPGGIIPTLGVEAIFRPTRVHLAQADLTIANLECPLTDTGTAHPTKPIVFRGSPENVAGLVYAGIDIVSLANNHVIDYGLEGLEETRQVLDSNSILHTGAGANSYEAHLPAFADHSGINVAFLACSDRTGQYDNYQPYLDAGYNKPGFASQTPYNISKQIQNAGTDADIIIYEIHAGTEYSSVPVIAGAAPGSQCWDNLELEDEFYSPYHTRPSRSDIEIRHHAIEEGADLLVCHHPHVLQGFEVYQGKLVAHSLGNFAFDQNYPETFPSVILNGKLDETGFYDFDIVPVYIDDYIPVVARGELGMYILDYLARRSRELNTYLIVSRDETTGKIVLDTTHLASADQPVELDATLADDNGLWTSCPLFLPRQGSISSIADIAPAAAWELRLGRETVWYGNFEDEGSTQWLINNSQEYYDTTTWYQGHRSLCQVTSEQCDSLVTNWENRQVCSSDTIPYTLHGHIKTDNVYQAGITVKFYTTRTGLYPIGEADLDTMAAGTSPWFFYHREFHPVLGTRYFDLCLKSRAGLSGDTGYAWFDNAGIIEWEEWQPFTGSNTFVVPNDYCWLQIRTAAQVPAAVLTFIDTRFNTVQVAESNQSSRPIQQWLHNYPNPFRGMTTIQYLLPKQLPVAMKIYNILGQEVKVLVDGTQSRGEKTVTWDGRDTHGRDLGSGIYFVSLKAGEYEQVRKIILLK